MERKEAKDSTTNYEEVIHPQKEDNGEDVAW